MITDGLNECGKWYLNRELKFQCPVCLDKFIVKHNQASFGANLTELCFVSECEQHLQFCRLKEKAKSLIKGESK